MIITRELILDVTCPEAIAFFNEHPEYFGLTRKQFLVKFREEETAGLTPNKEWLKWGNEYFFKAESIVHGNKPNIKRLGIYRITAPGLQYQEFDDIDDAAAALEVEKNKQLEAEKHYFHIQLRAPHGPSGYEIIKNCDTTADSCEVAFLGAYFAVFNMNTGTYENFMTFGQAKNRMIELRNARHALVLNNFMIQEKVKEKGDVDASPEDFIIVQTLSGRKTKYHDRLDRVERRPDPKPKPPKPPKP